MGIKVHSAGEWILDNFYIIEENVKSIQKDILSLLDNLYKDEVISDSMNTYYKKISYKTVRWLQKGNSFCILGSYNRKKTKSFLKMRPAGYRAQLLII